MPDVLGLPPLSAVKDPAVRSALEAIYAQLRVRNGEVGNAKFLTEKDTRALLADSYAIKPVK